MLYNPSTPEFTFFTGNKISNRPVASGGWGTQITPGNNTFPAYVEILSDTLITKDCYWIEININNVAVSTQARNLLVNIGIDRSGGTSFTDFITGLLGSCAVDFNNSTRGTKYSFPVYIPAGSSLAAKASVNNATVGSAWVQVKLKGAPKNLYALQYGNGVESVGVTTASSSGTAITSGTTSEGAWTSLGTTTRKCFAWQMGFGIGNNAMSGLVYSADLSYGDGTNNQLILQDMAIGTSTAETASVEPMAPGYCDVPIGGTLYGRLQCSGTANTGLSLAAYGVY